MKLAGMGSDFLTRTLFGARALSMLVIYTYTCTSTGWLHGVPWGDAACAGGERWAWACITNGTKCGGTTLAAWPRRPAAAVDSSIRFSATHTRHCCPRDEASAQTDDGWGGWRSLNHGCLLRGVYDRWRSGGVEDRLRCGGVDVRLMHRRVAWVRIIRHQSAIERINRSML